MSARKPRARRTTDPDASPLTPSECHLDGEIRSLTPLADALLAARPLLCQSALGCAIRHMQDFALLLDPDQRVIAMSDAACDLLGLPLGSDGFCMTADLRPGPVTDANGKPMGFDESAQVRALRGECVESLEMQLLSDGKPRHFLVNGTPIRDESGEVAMALVVARDISELKELQLQREKLLADLERQEAAEQAIIDNMPAGIVVVDSELKILSCNKAYARHFDASLEWQVGVRLVEVLPLAEQSGVMSLIRRAFQRGRKVSVRNFRYEGAKTGPTYWSGSAIPVEFPGDKGSIYAVAVVVVDVTEENLARERLAKVASLAEQRARDLERERRVAMEGYVREHAIAEKLQRSFLADSLPSMRSFEVARCYHPAVEADKVGGDFYDVFDTGDGRYGVVIGDVAGKGPEAAVYTAMAKYMLKAYAFEDCAPDRALTRLNDALCASTPDELFITLVYGILDPGTLEFTYASAGHEQPIHCCGATGTTRLLPVTGRALALETRADYTAAKVAMRPGDVLLLYTDGVTDAGHGRDRLGQENVARLIRESTGLPLCDIADIVLGRAKDISGGKLTDDAAVLAVRALKA